MGRNVAKIDFMRTVPEYVEIIEEKYKEDHEITGISWQECVDIVVDRAFFEDEITYPIVDPLKEKLIKIIYERNK